MPVVLYGRYLLAGSSRVRVFHTPVVSLPRRAHGRCSGIKSAARFAAGPPVRAVSVAEARPPPPQRGPQNSEVKVRAMRRWQ